MPFSRAGFLIYSGTMPLVKTFLTILLGYILARKGLFTPAASRGASQVTMNISLPALIFSNVVPAFSPSNVSAIFPLFLSAFLYQGIGFLFGLIIREVCYVPRNFYQGLVVLTGLSNWGNLPTAVVFTVTQQPPFDPSTDPALGISFVAIFIVAYNIVFWIFGAARSLSWDYLPNVPQGEAAERRVSWKEKPIGSWISRVLLRQLPDAGSSSHVEEVKEKADNDLQQDCQSNNNLSDQHAEHDLPHTEPGIQLTARSSRVSITSFRPRQLSTPPLPTFRIRGASPVTSSSHLSGEVNAPSPVSPLPESSTAQSTSHEFKSKISKFMPPFLARLIRPLANVLNPITLSLLISLPIALVQPLKALFIDTTQVGGPNWKGPDGRPPLYFIIDTAAFLGGITVPMALILLGASFARLSITRPLSRLAIPAMFAVAFAKMFLLPVIGIFWVQAMVKRGIIAKQNKTERFVAMFLSGTPAAVFQLIVTQMYAPDGNVDTLSAFLLVQYALMFFSSAALTAVSLALL